MKKLILIIILLLGILLGSIQRCSIYEYVERTVFYKMGDCEKVEIKNIYVKYESNKNSSGRVKYFKTPILYVWLDDNYKQTFAKWNDTPQTYAIACLKYAQTALLENYSKKKIRTCYIYVGDKRIGKGTY